MGKTTKPATTPQWQALEQWAFPEQAREAVYQVIAARRDIRNFRPDPVSDDLLRRVLEAAHQAPSVGFMQPWDFVLIRDPARRRQVYELFRQANERAAVHYSGDRASHYASLKLQGLLDAPLSLCVTCDTRRGGPHVLGRDTIPETDIYSTCLAVQNLWLAARAEGLGVGWMSIVDNQALAVLLELPEGVLPIAFLCVGFPVVVPDNPMLESTGWRGRLPLNELIHEERWTPGSSKEPESASVQDPPGSGPVWSRLEELTAATPAYDFAGERASRVQARLDQLTKPQGSMGRIEELSLRLACIQDRDYPRSLAKAILVFAADHGVVEAGVSAYRSEVTARQCYNFIAGGSVINALARQHGARLEVVDVGVDHDFDLASGIRSLKVARRTRNFLEGPAMSREEALEALLVGARSVSELGRLDLLGVGEIGIGNTAASSALAALLIGCDPERITGSGSGVGSATLDRKVETVRRGVERHRGAVGDVVGGLAAVGGFEIAALTGAILAAAALRIPVLLDGFITGVAALAATQLAPQALGCLVASHRSSEKGHAIVLERLGLKPLLELDLRLGEASGAALAIPMVDAACALLTEVRTFQEAGMEDLLIEKALE